MSPGPLPPTPSTPRLRVAGAGAGASGGASLGASVLLHAALLVGAVWLGVGRPDGGARTGPLDGQPPRLLSVVPAPEAPVEPELDVEAPELVLALPEEAPERPEALPELALEPAALLPEPHELRADHVAPEPLPAPADLLARVRPRATAPAALPDAPAPAAVGAPARAPALAVAQQPPAPTPGRALAPRHTPTPAWPAAVPFEQGRRVGVLFYVRADGSLADVRVEASSGVAALDEHVRAFVARTWSFEPTDQPRWARQSFRPAALVPAR